MKHLNLLFFAIITVCTASIFSSCTHDTEEFDGPFLVDRFGDFMLVDSFDVNRDEVDFAVGERVFFTARFNKRINWIVEIVGQESGATKVIADFANELTIENATWDGSATGAPLFGAEPCRASLIIPEADSIRYEVSLTTLSSKINEGIVFADFEEDLGANLLIGNFEFELTNNSGRTNIIPPAEGDFCFFFEGTDDVVPNFFTGLADIKTAAIGETYIPFNSPVPEDNYFNAFVYSDGGPHGIAVIQFIIDTNDSGDFEDGQDGTVQIEGDYPLDWVGWRLISHPMSDLDISSEDLARIVAIRLLLISDMNAQPDPPLQVDYAIDYIIFTEGGPFE